MTSSCTDPPKEQIKQLKRSIVVLNEALAAKTSELQKANSELSNLRAAVEWQVHHRDAEEAVDYLCKLKDRTTPY